MRYKFEDIIYNITEKKKPTEEDRLNYIGLEHLDSGSLFVSRWGSDVTPEGEKIIMKKGDVLFGKRRAYQKKVAISPIDGIFSAHGMVLRPKENVICKEYLPFFISSDYFLSEAIRISVGGLSPTINWKDIKVLEFDLPPLSEQKLIAEKLWAAYKVKQSYLKMIEATDEMVKSQFIEMFGSPFNPKFEAKKLSDVCSFKSGTTLPAESEKEQGDYIYAKVSDMNLLGNEVYIHYSTKYVDKEIAKNTWLPKGTVVFPKRGAAIYTNKKRILATDTCVDLNTIGVIPSNSIDPIYLYWYFKCIDLKGVSENSGIPQINNKNLIPLIIGVPSIAFQKQFISIAEQADKSKFELRKSIETIDKVIKSLINENL